MPAVAITKHWITAEEIQEMNPEERQMILNQLTDAFDALNQEEERIRSAKLDIQNAMQKLTGTSTSTDDLPLVVSDRFKNMGQKEAAIMIFRETNNKPLTPFELAKQIVANGYVGKLGERDPGVISRSLASMLSASKETFENAERGKWALKYFPQTAGANNVI